MSVYVLLTSIQTGGPSGKNNSSILVDKAKPKLSHKAVSKGPFNNYVIHPPPLGFRNFLTAHYVILKKNVNYRMINQARHHR